MVVLVPVYLVLLVGMVGLVGLEMTAVWSAVPTTFSP